MTEAKAIRNSVEGRDVPRGPSATQLHDRAIATAIERVAARASVAMVCRSCGRESEPHAATCYIADRYDWTKDAT